jgi:hypothetical protein
LGVKSDLAYLGMSKPTNQNCWIVSWGINAIILMSRMMMMMMMMMMITLQFLSAQL